MSIIREASRSVPRQSLERSGHVDRKTYFVVACTEKYSDILTFHPLVEDVAHFLCVGVEGERSAPLHRWDGNLKQVPRSAPIFCTVVRGSTSEDKCLDGCRGIRQSAAG